MYILFLDVPTSQEDQVWVFKEDPKLTMGEKERVIKKSNVCRILQKYREGQENKAKGTVTANWYHH